MSGHCCLDMIRISSQDHLVPMSSKCIYRYVINSMKLLIGLKIEEQGRTFPRHLESCMRQASDFHIF